MVFQDNRLPVISISVIIHQTVVSFITALSLCNYYAINHLSPTAKPSVLEMWANAQRDGRPAEYRWRPLLNAANFG